MNTGTFFKIWFLSYIFVTIAEIAGKRHEPMLLYAGIAIACWVLLLRFPVFKYPSKDKKEEN